MFIEYFHHIVAIIACTCFYWKTGRIFLVSILTLTNGGRRSPAKPQKKMLVQKGYQLWVQCSDNENGKDRGTYIANGLREPYTVSIAIYTKVLSGILEVSYIWSHSGNIIEIQWLRTSGKYQGPHVIWFISFVSRWQCRCGSVTCIRQTLRPCCLTERCMNKLFVLFGTVGVKNSVTGEWGNVVLIIDTMRPT